MVWWLIPVILAMQEDVGRRISVKGWPQAKNSKTLFEKSLKSTKGFEDMTQVVQHLPSKLKALSSNPSTIKTYILYMVIFNLQISETPSQQTAGHL
jgi:hypothetical protein